MVGWGGVGIPKMHAGSSEAETIASLPSERLQWQVDNAWVTKPQENKHFMLVGSGVDLWKGRLRIAE